MPSEGELPQGSDASLVYKFVELSTVTDETIEEAVNTTVAEGWALERIHFVIGESSRRPQMAFIAFTKPGTRPVE